jgi:integrase/recombinase XerC
VKRQSRVEEAAPPLATRSLVDSWLETRQLTTRRAYGSALADFARFCEGESVSQAVTALLQLPAALANRLVARYRDGLVEQGFAAASINQRLSALCSLSRMARRRGVIGWILEVERLPNQATGESGDVGRAGYLAMLAAVGNAPSGDPPGKVVRDLAILRLLHDAALRCIDLVALDIADFDPSTGRLRLSGGKAPKPEWLPLPAATRRAVAAWSATRRELAAGEALPADAPLFVNLSRDPAQRGIRLSGRSVGRLVAAIAATAGVQTTPLGLRRLAIAEALTTAGGDLRAVQRFSRHVTAATILRHDLRRRGSPVAAPAPVE